MCRRVASAVMMLGKGADQRLDAKPKPPAHMPVNVVPDDEA